MTGSGVTTYSLHPGVVRTDLNRENPAVNYPVVSHLVLALMWPFTKSPEEGAQTTIYCAVDPSIAAESGKYYRYVVTHFRVWSHNSHSATTT